MSCTRSDNELAKSVGTDHATLCPTLTVISAGTGPVGVKDTWLAAPSVYAGTSLQASKEWAFQLPLPLFKNAVFAPT